MLKCATIFLVLSIVTNSSGQWIQKSNGLFGGRVNSLLALNGKIFAGTSGGIFVSSDSALTWSPLNKGIETIKSLALATVNNNLYSVDGIGNVYKSVDFGLNWTPIEVGSFPNKLAVIGDTVFVSYDGWQLYAIKDGAITPQLINTIQSPTTFTSSDSRLILGSFDQGIFISDDRGKSWNHQALTGRVLSLSEANGNLLATTYEGAYLSSDRGNTWSLANLPWSTNYNILSLGDKLIASSDDWFPSESNDSGLTWNYNANMPNLSCLTSDSLKYYGGGSYGVHRTNDGGFTWGFSNSGMTNAEVQKILSFHGSLFATSGNRLFKSDNNAESWSELFYGNSTKETLQCISIIGNSIYLGTMNSIYVSVDNGSTWSINYSAPNGMMHFAKTSKKQFIHNYDGIFSSIDNGASWQLTDTDKYITGMNSIGDDLFIFGVNGNYKISDNGTKTRLGSVFMETGYEDFITSITAFENGLICTTGNSGIIFSSNGGLNWQHLTTLGGALEIIEKDNVLYTATYQQGIMTSTDAGFTWQSANQGLNFRDDWWRAWTPIYDLEIVGDSMFAATSWGGVWRSHRASLITGIEKTEHSLKIYPNPTTGDVIIDLTEFSLSSPKEIQILGIRGEVLQSLRTNNEFESIDLSLYPSGLYLVRINDFQKSQIGKIIRK